MNLDHRELTVGEASYVVERPAATINRAVDRGLIRAGRQPRRGKQAGPGVTRTLGEAELRYLLVEAALEENLTLSARSRVYQNLQTLLPGEHQVQVGHRLALDLRDVDSRIAVRLARLAEVRSHIDEGGTEAVLRGSDGVPVHVVAALVAGQGLAATLEDYPSLSGPQLDAAVEYARAYPKPGRPYPPRSFKRMLGDLADQGVFEPDNGGDETRAE